MSKKLYMIQTRAKTGLFYVVADGVDDAYQMVRDDLDNIGYGTIKEREFESATLLADSHCNPDCGTRLFMQCTCIDQIENVMNPKKRATVRI